VAALTEAVGIAAGGDVGDAEAGDAGGGEQFEVVDGHVDVLGGALQFDAVTGAVVGEVHVGLGDRVGQFGRAAFGVSWGGSSQCTSFRPTMQPTSPTSSNTLARLTGSEPASIPKATVRDAPMPTHTAYDVPVGSSRMA